MDTERWIAGPEYEDEVVDRLGVALRTLGYALGDMWSAVAGSQDIRHWEVEGPHGRLTIESETYIGVSVEGAAGLVAELRERFSARS